MEYYLAIDIGASSGRHILGWVEDGVLRMEEIHRFPNGAAPRDGSLCWDYEGLTASILEGLKKAGEMGKAPAYIGIDTWGVDYVLLDGADRPLGKFYAYRDSRTEGADAAVAALVPEAELYAHTGCQSAWQRCSSVMLRSSSTSRCLITIWMKWISARSNAACSRPSLLPKLR